MKPHWSPSRTNCIGYGRLDADVWILGMEEAGGGENNIRTRLKFQSVEDNAEAHKMLGVTHLHWGKRKIQRTWRGMCYIMLRLEGNEPTTENIRTHQAERLGRFEGNTLLTELMPIQKPKVHKWGYEELIPQFSSREDYYKTVKPRRITYLRRLIEEYKPPVIIGYGKAFWSDYQELFEGPVFKQAGQFQTTVFVDTLVILTGHFAARSMNGRFDELATIIQHIAQSEFEIVSHVRNIDWCIKGAGDVAIKKATAGCDLVLTELAPWGVHQYSAGKHRKSRYHFPGWGVAGSGWGCGHCACGR